MAELMARQTSTLKTLQKGEKIEATVKSITPSEILLDVGAKTEAVVLEKERRLFKQLLQNLKVGDKVMGTVISVESEMGYPLISLRSFSENSIWEKLAKLEKSQEKMPVSVTESTKGGFLVEMNDGTHGFLPNSHVTGDAQSLVGQTIEASIVEINREQRKIIFSQKGMLTDEQFKTQTAKLKAGSKVEGIISGVTSFGLFVNVPTEKGQAPLDGFIHISEVSWERESDLGQKFAVGDKIVCVVTGFDRDNKRIELSLKKLSEDPFTEIAKEFPLEKKVTGEVKEISDQGIVLDLGQMKGKNVEGLIRKDKISPNSTYVVGQEVIATVVQIDPRKRKILLTPVLKEKPLMYR